MTSFTEENYLKSIYHLSGKSDEVVSTSALAEASHTKAASVTDMLRRLSEKELIHYKKYQGVTLTEEGKRIALKIIRRHRLWEVFLVEKLGFKWDEIHEIAEQLEHIDFTELTDRLESFLGTPLYDPHGDPIPNKSGEMPSLTTTKLSNAPLAKKLTVRSVSEDSAAFLQHLDRLAITIGTTIFVRERSDFDSSIIISYNNGVEATLSKAVSDNLFVTLN